MRRTLILLLHTRFHFCTRKPFILCIYLFIFTDGFIEGSVSATRIAFYIISGVLILFALVFAWVGAELQELNGKAWKFPTVVRFLRVLSDLFFTGPLFVPVVGCLWLQFLPQSAVSSTVGGVTVVSVVTTFDSSSGDFIGHAIGAAIVLFIYLLVAALLAGTYYERFPTAAVRCEFVHFCA